jgi:very-short-patch-repair endonuclease
MGVEKMILKTENLTMDYAGKVFKRGELPIKEDLVELYINQNATVKELVDFFGVPVIRIERWLKSLGIKKPPELRNARNTEFNVFCTSEGQEKARQGKLEKYGSETFNNSEKRYNTNMEKYGVSTPFQSEEVKEKIAQTKIERYGDANYNNRDKARETTIQKYGVENISQADIIKEKKIITTVEHYGVKNVSQAVEIKEKKIATSLTNYGVENPFQSEEVLSKSRETNKEKYGTEYWAQKDIPKETLEILSSADNLKSWIQSQPIKTTIRLAETLHISYSNLETKIKDYDLTGEIKKHISSYELEINNLFGQIFRKDKTVLDGFEIDLYSAEHKFGIEFNGDYWHSTEYKDADYHLNKTNLAKFKGVFILHIWEEEYKNNKEFYINRIRMILENKRPDFSNQKIVRQDLSTDPDYWFEGLTLKSIIPPQLVKTDRFDYYNCGYKIYS